MDAGRMMVLVALLKCALSTLAASNVDSSCQEQDAPEPEPLSFLQFTLNMSRSDGRNAEAPGPNTLPVGVPPAAGQGGKILPLFDLAPHRVANRSVRVAAAPGAGELVEHWLNSSLAVPSSLPDGWNNAFAGLFVSSSQPLSAQMAGLARLVYNTCPGTDETRTWKTVAGWELALTHDGLMCRNLRRAYGFTADADGHDNYAMFVNKDGIPGRLPAQSCALVIEGTSDTQNLMNDFRFAATRWCDKVVHTGFLEELSQLIGGRASPEDGPFRNVVPDPMWQDIKDYIDSDCSGKIYVVGHSLGGVQAEMLAYCLDHHNNPEAGLYTFGAPGSHYYPTTDRMTNEKNLHDGCFEGARFWNSGDPIAAITAHIPTGLTSAWGMGHAEVIATRLEGSSSNLLAERSESRETLSCSDPNNIYAPTDLRASTAYHAMGLYLSRLAGDGILPDGILGKWKFWRSATGDLTQTRRGQTNLEFLITMTSWGAVFIQGGTLKRGGVGLLWVTLQSRLLPESDTKYCARMQGQPANPKVCFDYWGTDTGGVTWLDGTALGTTFEAYKLTS